MGGGTDYRRTTTRARPLDLLTAVRGTFGDVGGSAGGGADEAAAFCSRQHAVTFQVPPDMVVPSVGQPVNVVRRNAGLRVDGPSGPLGTIGGPLAKALLGCVAMGFTLSGSVVEIDGRTVRVLIVGDRPAAA